MNARTRGSSSRGAMIVVAALALLSGAIVAIWAVRTRDQGPGSGGSGISSGPASSQPADAPSPSGAPSPGAPEAQQGRPPAPATSASASGGLPAAVRYFDGERWSEIFPADDELLVAMRPDTPAGYQPPGAQSVERAGDEAFVRVRASGAEELRRRATEWQALPEVREVRPVYYGTLDALVARDPGQRLALTRQIAVEIEVPDGQTPQEAVERYSARVLSELPYRPGTYLVEVPTPFDTLDTAARMMEDGWPSPMPQFARRQFSRRDGGGSRLVPNDPLFSEQYHHQNTGQTGGTTGEDIRSVAAWDTRQGSGIVVCILDDGVEGAHEDLTANYSAALSTDINDGDADPSPGTANDNHGTQVAGCAAARGNNGIGVSGSAPQATLAGVRLTAAGVTDAQEAQGMSWQNGSIHVKSNSWGPADGNGTLSGQGTLTRNAITDGVTNGRGGLGVVYLWAAGNGGLNGPDDVNYDGYANNRNVIAVSAVTHNGTASSFSEQGAATLVTAPGSLIRTVDRMGANGDDAGNYVVQQGTSFSTPITAGVVALILEANPNLTYRDVMWILVNTARTNDPTDSGWATNGSGRDVSHKYGHGSVDAQAAVAAAATFSSVGGASSETVQTGAASPASAIPDNNAGGVTSTIAIGTAITVEHVEVEFSSTHSYRGDLDIQLTSPSGTVSRLARVRSQDNNANYTNWVFQTTLCWGENAQGNWTLQVADLSGGDTGTFDSWTLRVYGAAGAPGGSGPPTMGFNASAFTFTATEGGSNPANQTLNLSNAGGGTLNAAVTDNQPWLSVSPTSASVNGGSSQALLISVDITGLAAGSYSGTITVTDANATNSPAAATVSLTVGAKPTPTVSTTSLTATALAVGVDAASQTFQVSNTGAAGSVLNVTCSADQTWVDFSATVDVRAATVSASIPAGQTATFTVNFLTSTLGAGTYGATITVTDTSGANAPRTVGVTATVPSSGVDDGDGGGGGGGGCHARPASRSGAAALLLPAAILLAACLAIRHK